LPADAGNFAQDDSSGVAFAQDDSTIGLAALAGDFETWGTRHGGRIQAWATRQQRQLWVYCRRRESTMEIPVKSSDVVKKVG